MMDEKIRKRGGRPVKSPSMKRDKIVQAKLTQMEYELVRVRAQRAGITPYEYLRRAVLNTSDCPKSPITKEGWVIIKELISCINNLYQKMSYPIFNLHQNEIGSAANDLKKTTEKLLDFLK